MGRIEARRDLTIFDALSRQHREVESLFAQIIALYEDGELEDVEPLFELLREKLLSHAEAEDTVVYERLSGPLHEEIGKAREEHGIVEILIDELTAIDVDDDAWKARIEVLQEMVQHHVIEEEQTLFPSARDELTAAESQALAERFLDLYAQLTGEDPRETSMAFDEAGARRGEREGRSRRGGEPRTER